MDLRTQKLLIQQKHLIGKFLYWKCRNKLHWEDVCAELGVSKSTMCRLINGDNVSLPIRTWLRIEEIVKNENMG